MVFTLYYVLRQLAVGTFTWYAQHEALHLVLLHTAVGKPYCQGDSYCRDDVILPSDGCQYVILPRWCRTAMVMVVSISYCQDDVVLPRWWLSVWHTAKMMSYCQGDGCQYVILPRWWLSVSHPGFTRLLLGREALAFVAGSFPPSSQPTNSSLNE